MSCEGGLTEQSQLVSYLESLAPEVEAGADEAPPTVTDLPACPECNEPMERDRYMGEAVEFCRCSSCHVLWLDRGVLRAMAAVLKRIDQRKSEREEAASERMKEASFLVDATLLSRSRSRIGASIPGAATGLSQNERELLWDRRATRDRGQHLQRMVRVQLGVAALVAVFSAAWLLFTGMLPLKLLVLLVIALVSAGTFHLKGLREQLDEHTGAELPLDATAVSGSAARD